MIIVSASQFHVYLSQVNACLAYCLKCVSRRQRRPQQEPSPCSSRSRDSFQCLSSPRSSILVLIISRDRSPFCGDLSCGGQPTSNQGRIRKYFSGLSTRRTVSQGQQVTIYWSNSTICFCFICLQRLRLKANFIKSILNFVNDALLSCLYSFDIL